MKSPLEEYKYFQNINNISGIAFDTLFNKYIVRNDKGDKKLWEIDSTDQESLMIRLNGGYPIPGFIYIFLYLPSDPKKDLMEISSGNLIKKYNDYVPLVFCTAIDNEGFRGINLNILPNLERLNFLETYYNTYKTFFNNIEELTENDKLALNMNYIKNIGSGNGQKLIEIFNKKAGANFNFAIRNYKLKKIKNFRMIEYAEWSYIPHYNSYETIKGISLKELHRLYYQSL